MKPGEFVTSDTHFGHRKIAKLVNRPFNSVQEMDDALIARWNAKVGPQSLVYHLGDFSLASRGRALEVLDRLNGCIILVLGNHDKVIKGSLRDRFESVCTYLETKTPNGTRVCLSHYPFYTWNKAHYGSWMLHGHCHASLKDTKVRRIDVGVDAHPNYEPFSYDEIVTRMAGRFYQAVDHHR